MKRNGEICGAFGTYAAALNDYLPYQEVWLYIRRYADGKVKYAFSNGPVDIKQEEIGKAALMRWPIEQCFEECKSLSGDGTL